MNKTAFRRAIRSLLDEAVPGLSLDERVSIVRDCLIQFQRDAELDDSNKGQSWTDDELRVVLQHSPTKENCILLARAFRRGYGSIEQIFRWAASNEKEVSDKRADDAFVKQIKRVAKTVGWRATQPLRER